MYTSRGVEFANPSTSVSACIERSLFPCTPGKVSNCIELQLLRRIVESVGSGTTLSRVCRAIVASWYPYGFETVQLEIDAISKQFELAARVPLRIFRALLIAVRCLDVTRGKSPSPQPVGNNADPTVTIPNENRCWLCGPLHSSESKVPSTPVVLD